MAISKKQLIVLIFGGLALLAVISVMVITQDLVPVQAAGQETSQETENSDSLSGGNDCYCAYNSSPAESTPAPIGAP